MRHDRIIRFDVIAIALLAFAVILGVSVVVCPGLTESQVTSWNIISEVLILGFGVAISGLLVKESPLNTLSPIPWFYLACGVYFGLGPLMFEFATPETTLFLNAITNYPIDSNGILEANTLSVAGIVIVTLGVIAGRRLFPWRQSKYSLVGNFDISLAKRSLWAFIVIGSVVKYLFAIPHRLGLLGWILPGFIQHLVMLLPAAIIISMLLVKRGMRQYIPVMWALIASELATALMSFAKLDVIFTVVAIAIGRYLCVPSLRFLMVVVPLVAVFYGTILSPFISFARETIATKGVPDFEVLIDGIGDYVAGRRAVGLGQFDLVQGWWARLCYSNYQKFAIDSYDSGNPGTSLEQAAYVLVPRLLFPEKEIIGFGGMYSDLMNPGSGEYTFSGPTMFGEGYWNAGIAGLVVICLWAGIVLAGFTSFAHRQLRHGRVAMLFVILLGIQTGMGPDFWFVPTFIGGVGEAIAYATILSVVLYLWGSRATATPGQTPRYRAFVDNR